MQSLAVYNHPSGDSSSNVDSGSGGGQVEDILKRLGNVETDVSELKSKVSTFVAIIPHLATKADVMDVRSAVAELRSEMSSEISSVRHELFSEIGSVRNELSSEISSVRNELSAEISSVRNELSAEISSVRNDMSIGFGALRAEMAAQSGSLRAEMAVQSGSLRAEMAAQSGSLRAEMGSLRAESAERETAFIKWMIATVLATGALAFTIAKFVH